MDFGKLLKIRFLTLPIVMVPYLQSQLVQWNKQKEGRRTRNFQPTLLELYYRLDQRFFYIVVHFIELERAHITWK